MPNAPAFAWRLGALRLARAALAVLAAVLVWGAACRGAAAQGIVVGAKDFTEQLLVAEMTAQLLKAHGITVHKGTGFTSSGVRTLQETGIVDLYWEYTGTSLIAFNRVSERLGPAETYARVKALDAERGLVWLAPSRINNTYALAMRRADAAQRGIRTISDLAAKIRGGERLRLAATGEFVRRPDGLQPLEETYGFAFGLGNVVGMENDAIYAALQRRSEFDVGVVFATDGRVSASDLTLLDDDRNFFPPYHLAPVVRRTTLERNPRLPEILATLSAQLDNPTIAALNASIDVGKRPIDAVASEFLRSRGLPSAR